MGGSGTPRAHSRPPQRIGLRNSLIRESDGYLCFLGALAQIRDLCHASPSGNRTVSTTRTATGDGEPR